jgi:hypothetical protein
MVCPDCVSAGAALTAGDVGKARMLHLRCPSNDPNKKNACDCQHRLDTAIRPSGLTKVPESDSLEGQVIPDEGTAQWRSTDS